MNKLGLVLGIAAVATFAGCKDPNHSKYRKNVQNVAQPVATTPVEEKTPAVTPVKVPEKDIEIVVTERHCACPPGTVHKEPCTCGATDCKCIVEPPAPVVTPTPVPAVEETTPYIVQRGDYLAKISKKYNITIASIRRVNPNLKGDTIRVGQTIRLPGKVNVGEQKVPTVAIPPRVVYRPYAGATKDYKIQNGDSLGVIAQKHGITTRQLKELNGLSSDVIRAGKTLKVPAVKTETAVPVKTAAAVSPAKDLKPALRDVKPAAPAADKKDETEVPPVEVDSAPSDGMTPPPADPAPNTVDPAPKTVEAGPTHVVRENEDLTSLSILYSLSPAEIRSFNNLGEDEELKPGQVIKLPADTQL